MVAPDPVPRSFPWTNIFVAVGVVLGAAFVVVVPALQGTDEVAHFTRVALIERGFVVPPTAGDHPADYRLDDCEVAFIDHHALVAYLGAPPDLADQFTNPECIPRPFDAGRKARAADVYSPVPYAPALVGFRVGRALAGAAGSLYGARLAQLAAYIALMALAIRRAPWGRPLLFTIALLPVSLQGAAGVSADPMTLALACATIAVTLRAIDTARSRPLRSTEWVGLGFLVAALVLCKSAYVPFALLILAIPTAAFVNRRRRVGVCGAILGGATVLAGAWNLGVVANVDIVGVNRSDSVVAGRWIRRHPRGFLGAVLHGWTTRTEAAAVLRGLFTPVRRFAHNFPLPLWLGLAWIVAARLVDPVPRALGRVRDTFDGLRDRTAGPESDRVAVTPSESAPGTAPIATDGGVPEPGFTGRERWWAAGIAAFVAVTSFLLVEYGLAIAANPPATDTIRWVQGRYLLPLLPLTLFGVSAHRRTLGRRWMVVFPVVSVGVSAWWIWWASHELWNWW